MSSCQNYNDLEQTVLDSQLAEQQDATNIVYDQILGNIFYRDEKGNKIEKKKATPTELKRVALLKEIRKMLLDKIEENPTFAEAFLKRMIFEFKHARPGRMNDQALSTTIAMHKRLKKTLDNLKNTHDITQRVASAYTEQELAEYIKEQEKTGNMKRLRPKLGSPKSWFNWVMDGLFPKANVTSPHLLAFKGESTGWAAKIVLDSMFLQDRAAILARPFRENVSSAYASLRAMFEFHLGRVNTRNESGITNTYFGPMTNADGDPLGDINNSESNSSREHQSFLNLLTFTHNIMRGKTRMVMPKELAVADDATRKEILDKATRKIIRYKGTDGQIRTLSGNVFTYRNQKGQIDDNYIFFKFMKPGKDGKRKVIRLNKKQMIPVDGKVIQDAGYTTEIADAAGNVNKYVMIQQYDGNVEYYEAYKLGFRVEIDKDGNEIVTNEPSLNAELSEMTEQYGFNYGGDPNAPKVMFMEAQTDMKSVGENVYESFDKDGNLKDYRKKRYWTNFRPMDTSTEFFNRGDYIDDNGVQQTAPLDPDLQMRALLDTLFAPKEIVQNSAEVPRAGIFSTVRELRHILSGKVKGDLNDNFDLKSAGFGYGLLQQLREMQGQLDSKLTKNFNKAKTHLMSNGWTDEDVYQYLLGMEDVGGYNPYQNLFINISLDKDNNVTTPNSYLGRDNKYFPDIYEDLVYQDTLKEAIANTKAEIMKTLDSSEDFGDDTQQVLDTLDSLDAADSIKKRLEKLKGELSALQTQLDMSLGRTVSDDAKRIIQNKSRHGRHRGSMMDRNDARLDANVLNEYISDMLRSMLINDIKADFYAAIADVTPEWRMTLYEQISASIGMPDNRAGFMGFDYRDERVAKWMENIHRVLVRNMFGVEGEPLNVNSVARLGVFLGKLQTANLMTHSTYLRNTGQTLNKMIGNGWDNWQIARQLANDPDVQWYAARSGILSLESFLGDAIFTAANVDWFMGGTSARFKWLAVYLSKGDEGVLDTFGEELTEDQKTEADLFLYKLILKADKGEITKKELKEEAKKFGKDAYKYLQTKRKRLQMLRQSVDDKVLLDRMKKPEIQKQIEELKKGLGDFIKFDPEWKPTNYKTDYKNLVRQLKQLKLRLSENEINKIVQAKLTRYYSNPSTKTGEAYGEDVFTLSGTEQRLRTEDFAMALLLAKKWGLINGWENYTAGDDKNPMSDPMVVWLARAHVLFNDYLVHSAGQPEFMRGAIGKIIWKFQNFPFHQSRAEKETMMVYIDSLDGNAFQKIAAGAWDTVTSLRVLSDLFNLDKWRSEGFYSTGKATNESQLYQGPAKDRVSPEKDEAQRLLIYRWLKTAMFETAMNLTMIGQMYIAVDSIGKMIGGVGRWATGGVHGPSRFAPFIAEGSMSPMVSFMMRLLFFSMYAMNGNEDEEELTWGRANRLVRGMPLVPIGIQSIFNLVTAYNQVMSPIGNQQWTVGRGAKYFVGPLLGNTEEIDILQQEIERLQQLQNE